MLGPSALALWANQSGMDGNNAPIEFADIQRASSLVQRHGSGLGQAIRDHCRRAGRIAKAQQQSRSHEERPF
jgi:hypothetical protein